MLSQDSSNYIDQQRTAIHAVLGRLLAGNSAALVGAPNHNNVGDSAIWLGEVSYLRRSATPVLYQCDMNTYRPESIHSLPERTTVLLHGGGNFGDIWPRQQSFRETVARDCKQRMVVQLPQTFDYSSPSSRAVSLSATYFHDNFAALARDRESYEQAATHGVDVSLCPDMAFCLGAIKPGRSPGSDVVWILRHDKEATSHGPFPEGLPFSNIITDWLLTGTSHQIARGRRALTVRTRSTLEYAARRDVNDSRMAKAAGHIARAVLDKSFTPLARLRTRRGISLLRHGRILVTDRLHAHILAVLMGVPSVVLDNAHGKIRRYHETFGVPPVTFSAGSLVNAAEIAESLLLEDAAS